MTHPNLSRRGIESSAMFRYLQGRHGSVQVGSTHTIDKTVAIFVRIAPPLAFNWFGRVLWVTKNFHLITPPTKWRVETPIVSAKRLMALVALPQAGHCLERNTMCRWRSSVDYARLSSTECARGRRRCAFICTFRRAR